MKKFLSLVLALVMTMSLVTISAGAKDFTDAGEINYAEAIDVISAVKVVDGYADGSFNPQATLTRGAAAKIICNLILGPTTASALSADAAPYSDVPANHTFAGYIAYCQKTGIISGYADGTFKPGNSLTGYAFMKMLLGALGYKAENEGYTGANWSINVAKQALAIGLDDGLVDDFDGVKPVNREEACLYAFNALQADMVEYKNSSTIVVGDITVTSSADATKVENKSTSYDSGTEQIMQFCEKYFPKLYKQDDYTAFDEVATTWRYKGKKIGSYADEPKLTYTGEIKLKDIWADLDISADVDTTLYYRNGEDLTNTPNVPKAAGVTKTNSNKVGGQGTVTTVFLKTSASTGKTTARIIEKEQFIGKIISIDAATNTTKRTVNLTGKGIGSASVTMTSSPFNANKFETEDFARGDYVYFTAAQNNNSGYDVKSLEKAEKVTGELTAFTGNSSVVVGGQTYKVNKVGFGGQDYKTNGGNLKDIVDLYLDGNGNVLVIETSEAADDSYAFVLAARGDGSSFSPYEAELLFLDGTKKVVKTDALATANEFASFRINSDEKYVLAVDSTYNYQNGALDLKNGVSDILVDGSNHYYGNDSTIYLVKTAPSGKTTYTVYTGHKNVPTIKGSSVGVDVVCKAGTVANYIFIDAANVGTTISGGTSNVLFLLNNADAGLTLTNDSSYYTFKAVNDGEIGEVKLDSGDYYSNYLKLSGDAVIVTGKYTDKYGVMKVTNGEVTQKAVGIGEVTKSTIGLQWNAGNQDFDKTLALSSKVSVFVVNTAKEISASDIDAIAHDTDDIVYYTVKDGAVDNIFIVKV